MKDRWFAFRLLFYQAKTSLLLNIFEFKRSTDNLRWNTNLQPRRHLYYTGARKLTLTLG